MAMTSGVDGFDKLVDGGFPDESVILLAGSAGTGKTIFSMQFLFEGVRKKEKSLLITFDQSYEKVAKQAKSFGWDVEKAEKAKLLRVINISNLEIVGILETIKENIDSFNPVRMVVDSITFMSLSAHSLKRLVDLESTTMAEIYDENEEHREMSSDYEGLVARKLLMDFVRILQKKKITAIFTSEVPKDSNWLSRDSFTEFVCDGALLVKATAIGSETHRTLEVVKMRNTKVKGGVHSFDFAKDGVKIKT